MTTNQIEYWKLQETTRHNQADEAIRKSSLQESQRHNLEEESIGRVSAGAQVTGANATMLGAQSSEKNAKTNVWKTIGEIGGAIIGGALTAVTLFAG